MAGGGKIPSNSGKIQQRDRNRSNDDASFKKAEQKFEADNFEREQKRRNFNFRQPSNVIGSRLSVQKQTVRSQQESRLTNRTAPKNISSVDGLAGRNSALDSSNNQESTSSYNARRRQAQTAKANKLATSKQKELVGKLSQAEQQNSGQSESLPTRPDLTPAQNGAIAENSNYSRYFSPVQADSATNAQSTNGQAEAIVGIPGQANNVARITSQGPSFSEDVIISEQAPAQNTATAQPELVTPKTASQNDAYETPLESAKDAMRPNFFPSLLGRPQKADTQKSALNSGNLLRNAENSASNLDSSFGLDAQTGENDVSSDFVNNVGAKKTEDDAGNRKVKSGFLKKRGPLMSIIISLLFSGGGMYMTQASLPFTILDKLNDTFDSQDVSVNRRSNVFTKLMAKNAKHVDTPSGAVKKNVFGKQKFKVSRKMRKRMRSNSLNIITDKSNPNVGKLEFTDKNGNTKVYTPAEFESAYNNNTEIRKAYDSAAHPWKTSVSNFFDKQFNKILTKFGIKKRALDGYDAKTDPTGQRARQAMADEVEGTFDEGGNNKKATGGANEDEDLLKDDDSSGGSADPNKKTDEVSAGKQKAAAISAKLSAGLNKAFKIQQAICIVPTIMTGATLIAQAYQLYQVVKIAMLFMSGVDQARAGDAASSPINALGRSLVEQSSERRFKSTVSAESDEEEADADDDYYYYSYEATEDFETEQTAPRSAIQSEGMSKLFTGDPIAEADESINSFNASKVLKGKFSEIEDEVKDNLGVLGKLVDGFDVASFLTDVSLDSGTFRACQLARMVLAYGLVAFDIASLVTSFKAAITGATTVGATAAGVCAPAGPLASAFCGGIGFVLGGLFSFWGASNAKKAIKQCIRMAVSWIGTLVAQWAASHISTFLVNMLKRKAVTEFFGEDLGNAIMSGSHSIMADNHRSSGGLLADKEGYMAMLIQQDSVNAEEAKSDRLARSPFDITSQNTFAGQLAATMTPVLLQSDSLLDTVGKFSSTIRNSAKVFSPSASAYDAAMKANYAKDYTAENCEALDSIGVVGDEFCNPYIATDFDTMFTNNDEDDDIEAAKNTPYDIIQKVGQSNFEDDIDESENPKIREGSSLATYILNCSERESAFGYADENIANQYEKKNDDIWHYLDVVSDYRDTKSAENILAHFGWIDGSNCVMHEDLDYDDAISYDEIKNFSRYMEDQRLAETMGVIEESAVTAFLDDYYEKNPKDMSPKAVLARMSGMTVETYDSIMAGIDVLDFIAHYDPTDYYPTPAIHKEDPIYTIDNKRMVENEGVLAIIYEYNSYDYYQRNFAVA